MLNTLKIKNAKSKGHPYRIADTGGPCKGLALHVSAKGHKSYNLCMRRDGKRKFWKIGDAANTPLSDARKDGLELRKMIELGDDPRKREPEAKVATLQDLCEAYLDYLKAKESKSWMDAERTLRMDCKTLYTKPANQITSPEIADLIRRPVKRGSLAQANRLRAYLQAAYNWGMAADLDPTQEKNGSRFMLTTNPVTPIPKPRKGSRALDRWLNEQEIKQVWYALPKYTGPVVVAALRMMICTGQRTNEVLGMHWDQIEDDVWYLPTTKNGKPHEVVLNKHALNVLREMKALTGHCDVIFPQNNATKTPMASNTLSHATRRMCKALDMLGFTPRDLRRTFKSMALKHSLDKNILDKVQNHAQHDVSSRHYVKYQFLAEKREAMGKWNSILWEILK